LICIPSMYLLLVVYSITNLNVVSWGTREVAVKKSKKQLEQEAEEALKNKEVVNVEGSVPSLILIFF
jgi:chitin synthase